MKKFIAFVVASAAAISFCASLTYKTDKTSHPNISPSPKISESSDERNLKHSVFVMDIESPISATENISELEANENLEEMPFEEHKKSESVSKEDIELLALLTMAEAEGEPEEGKRLVIDTVLNRADFGGEFPSTIRDVIYQRNQFTSMWNGRVDCCYVMDEIVQLVIEELDNRTNYDVIFFNAGDYSQYGVPMFQVGNHYFSSYN